MHLINKHYNKIGRKPLAIDVINDLVYKAQAGDLAARNTIIEHNMGLAIKLAYKGQFINRLNHRIEMDDCFQEAIFGLNRAIELFDPSKGFAFSTYAYWWVQQTVMRYIDNNRHIIRTPVHQGELQRKYNKIQLEYEGRDEEFYINLIAFENNKSPESVRNSLSFKIESLAVSLDTSVNDEIDDGVYKDNPIDRLEQLTFSIDTTNLDAYYIKKIAELLPERNMKILMLRMDNWSLDAIGEMVGITKEAVRLIEKKTLIKLKAMVNKVQRR